MSTQVTIAAKCRHLLQNFEQALANSRILRFEHPLDDFEDAVEEGKGINTRNHQARCGKDADPPTLLMVNCAGWASSIMLRTSIVLAYSV
jgi:hypothetical protein